ncbi:MAG TPA: DUF6209 family protein [Myxococcota bacterium]
MPTGPADFARFGMRGRPPPVARISPADRARAAIERALVDAARPPADAPTIDADDVHARIDVIEPKVERPTSYEARMSRQSFAGFAITSGGAAVPISKNKDGRTPSFVAEAGKKLSVIVDAEMIPPNAVKAEVAFYLASAGNDTKQRVPLPTSRDPRSGALVVAPGALMVPDDAVGTLRLSVEVTLPDGKVQSTWSPHYDALVLPKAGATVVFDEDWSVTASEGVRAGESLSIAYDADRLRSILGDEVQSAVACVSFDGKAPLELPLWHEGAMLLPSLQVPFDATRAAVWFRGSSRDQTAYDSRFGENYSFPVALPKDDADESWKRAALTLKGLPKLTQDNFTAIGPCDGGYNCIAWSLGSRAEWVWPGESIAAFDELYRRQGYEPLGAVDDDALKRDPALDKIALYGLHNSGGFEVTHAARMDANGTWTSKLGTETLIRHVDVHVVEGPSYGELARVYARRRSGPLPTPTGPPDG